MPRRHFLFFIENDMMQIYKVKRWKFGKLRISRISWRVNASSDEKTQLIMERPYVSSTGTHLMGKFSQPCRLRKRRNCPIVELVCDALAPTFSSPVAVCRDSDSKVIWTFLCQNQQALPMTRLMQEVLMMIPLDVEWLGHQL